MRATRAIMIQAVADAITDAMQKDHDFIPDLNTLLNGKGLTIALLEDAAVKVALVTYEGDPRWYVKVHNLDFGSFDTEREAREYIPTAVMLYGKESSAFLRQLNAAKESA